MESTEDFGQTASADEAKEEADGATPETPGSGRFIGGGVLLVAIVVAIVVRISSCLALGEKGLTEKASPCSTFIPSPPVSFQESPDNAAKQRFWNASYAILAERRAIRARTISRLVALAGLKQVELQVPRENLNQALKSVS